LCWQLVPTHINASADDDKKAVAALDTQYQAAVEKNDAATMDRILADDFTLVTGNGKTYTKNRLAEGSAQQERCLRTPKRYGTDGACVGRHGGRHCKIVGERHGGRKAFRQDSVVQ
jgi:hypothetical protein